ncbi:hypothetical protein ACQP25_05105 [Microtetraspora malaysiensis]|uniref:hypothetical protein n=1 Tax=Microtetraspora malaysiensis TaxID=161358 RepID=UPI003D8FC4E1
MSIPYLTQPEQQQTLEWLGGSTYSVLLDAAATGGQLTVGRSTPPRARLRRSTCTPAKTKSSC